MPDHGRENSTDVTLNLHSLQSADCQCLEQYADIKATAQNQWVKSHLGCVKLIACEGERSFGRQKELGEIHKLINLQ